MGDKYFDEDMNPITFEEVLESSSYTSAPAEEERRLIRQQVIEEVKKLIIEEINIAHQVGEKTLRLNSLYNKLTNLI